MTGKSNMYTNHFALSNLPFENVPDPAFFFNQGDYHHLFQRLTDCVRAGRGLMIVAGPIGAGKTTLSQKLMSTLPESTKVIWLAEPPENSRDLFLLVLQELSGDPTSSGRSFLLRDIRACLLNIHSAGGRCLLIVDESHKMPDEVLEGVRLLNNLEKEGSKHIQILLLGQEEFLTTLNREDLTSFKQRVAALEVIGKMEPHRVQEYINHRLQIAGSRSPVFNNAALDAIANITGGIPRVTNSLCDKSLYVAYNRKKAQVGLDDVQQAAKDLGLEYELFFYLTMKGDNSEPKAHLLDSTLREEFSTSSAVSEANISEHSAMSDWQKGPSQPIAKLASSRTVDSITAKEIQENEEERTVKPKLIIPLIFLFSSMCLFAISLRFYHCTGTGAGPESCLESLLRLPF